jgi:hypothetical protein
MEFENAVASQNWKTLILVLWKNDWTGHFSIRLWLEIGIAIISSFAEKFS